MPLATETPSIEGVLFFSSQPCSAASSYRPRPETGSARLPVYLLHSSAKAGVLEEVHPTARNSGHHRRGTKSSGPRLVQLAP